jgi:hypothetical protein
MTLLDDRQDPHGWAIRRQESCSSRGHQHRGARPKQSSVSWKAPGVAEVEDPDVRRDTFLPARCRNADSGPASS